MPHDIALATNTAIGTLELRQAQPLPDGQSFGALLVVRSGGLAAALPFFFTRQALRQFVDRLDALGTGEARLGAREGGDFVALTTLDDERAAVFGELQEDDGVQQMRFRFETPRHGLESLAAGARRLLLDFES